jgi:hypothetical protein
MSSSETEQSSRFGDKAASGESLQAGKVVWRNGTEPVLVVKVNTVEGDDPGAGNTAAEVATLDVETVHVDDLAMEYVAVADQDTSGAAPAGVPIPAPPAPPAAAPQPTADDPTRQTTPTGTETAAGTGAPPAAAAGTTAEADQDARIAALEQKLADAEARANAPVETTEPAPAEAVTTPIGPVTPEPPSSS